MIRTRNLTIFSVNVWCGFWNGYIIGPCLYNENLTGVRYLGFLENELPRLLRNVPHNRAEIWFQQDDTPPHNSNIVINYLNNTFPWRWIGESIRWPTRSLNLTPLEFFLWRYLKSQVYQKPIEDMADLYYKIYASIDLKCISMNSEKKSITYWILWATTFPFEKKNFDKKVICSTLEAS